MRQYQRLAGNNTLVPKPGTRNWELLPKLAAHQQPLMNHFSKLVLIIVFFSCTQVFAQGDSIIVNKIVKEANDNSQLEKLAHELFDRIGPRLVGTPQMKQANDWA